MSGADVIWGTQEPQLIFDGRVVTLPPPTEIALDFKPEFEKHVNPITGQELHDTWRFRLVGSMYFDFINVTMAVCIRDAVNFCKGNDILLKPHKDFSKSYYVRINEEVGWNLRRLSGNQGYTWTMYVRGTALEAILDESQKLLGHLPCAACVTIT